MASLVRQGRDRTEAPNQALHQILRELVYEKRSPMSGFNTGYLNKTGNINITGIGKISGIAFKSGYRYVSGKKNKTG